MISRSVFPRSEFEAARMKGTDARPVTGARSLIGS
jgi:hypothetical protein